MRTQAQRFMTDRLSIAIARSTSFHFHLQASRHRETPLTTSLIDI